LAEEAEEGAKKTNLACKEKKVRNKPRQLHIVNVVIKTRRPGENPSTPRGRGARKCRMKAGGRGKPDLPPPPPSKKKHKAAKFRPRQGRGGGGGTRRTERSFHQKGPTEEGKKRLEKKEDSKRRLGEGSLNGQGERSIVASVEESRRGPAYLGETWKSRWPGDGNMKEKEAMLPG